MNGRIRTINSFVRRGGRMTAGRRLGLGKLWGEFGVDLGDGMVDFDGLFLKCQPLILEVGFGNGDSLLQMASDNLDKNFLGIEVYEAGVGGLVKRAADLGLSNLKVIKDDAIMVLENHIKDDSFAGFQLFFPDPWHKKKHHKRRIVQTDFLDLIGRKVRAGGVCHIATDWQPYALHILQKLEQNQHFQNTQNAYNYTPRPNFRPKTKFELRGEKLGHKVFDLIFEVL